MTSTTVRLKPGDVIRYLPEERHCYEGCAIAEERDGQIYLVDTFWGSGGDKVVHPTEFEVQFNLNDFERVPNVTAWEMYAAADRGLVTHQHWLQQDYYVRKGATEDLETQIELARERLETAEGDVESAKRRADWRGRELAALIAKRPLTPPPSTLYGTQQTRRRSERRRATRRITEAWRARAGRLLLPRTRRRLPTDRDG